MRGGVAFIEGEHVKAEDAKLSIFDMGFTRSDVVYDVVSSWKSLFFRLDDRTLSNGKPGAITSELRELYWAKREAGWLGTPVGDLITEREAA